MVDGPAFDRTAPLVPDPPGPPDLPPTGGANDFTRNVHTLIPNEVVIKAGGSVNFIVAGFHQIVIYGNGKKPEDVNTANPLPIGPGLIDDSVNRIFRGVNPTTVPQDRVEVVNFATRGRYLVICAVLPHFEMDMYGWVTVLP